jgi:electron transfer flavoprotein beta subunit
MNLAVCVKEVLDTRLPLQVLPQSGDVVQSEIEQITLMNPADRAALEIALQIKSKDPVCRVEAFSVCETDREGALYFALARGADAAERLEPHTSFPSSRYTALMLASRFIGEGFDLICCGDETLDNASGMVGPLIAELLDLPQVTGVKRVTEWNERTLLVERSLDRGHCELVELELPGLVTFKAVAAEVGYVSVRRIEQARQRQIFARRLDLELPDSRLPKWPESTKQVTPRARVKKTFTPDANLPAAERMKLIMAGGLVSQPSNQASSVLAGDSEYISEQLYRFLRHHEFV